MGSGDSSVFFFSNNIFFSTLDKFLIMHIDSPYFEKKNSVCSQLWILNWINNNNYPVESLNNKYFLGSLKNKYHEGYLFETP